MANALQDIYERLEELDPTSFETDAIKLLTGLGFEQKMLAKATKVRCDLTTSGSASACLRRSRGLAPTGSAPACSVSIADTHSQRAVNLHQLPLVPFFSL